MKYVCRQINPEYQESPLWKCGYSGGEINVENEATYDGLYLIPDANCYGIKYDEFNTITEDAVADLMQEWECLRQNKMYASYDSLTQALNSLCERADGKTYTTKQVHEWKEILEKDGTWELTDNDKCTILSLVFGNEWDWAEIRGCSQGDYAEVFYRTDMWTSKAIETLESEYFNMGSEWLCDDTGIEDTEEITEDSMTDSFSVYAYEWNDEAVRAELADAIGCDVQDVVMFKYSGSHRVSDYEMI